MRFVAAVVSVIIFSTVCAAQISLDIFHANSGGIDSQGRAIYHSGPIVVYSHSIQLKQTIDGVLGLTVIDRASSSHFYGKDRLNLMIRGGVGTSFDTDPEGVLGMRFSTAVGLLLMNFSDFGWFLSASPVFYARIGSLFIGLGGGIDLIRYVEIDMTGTWLVRFEIGYVF
jgi:hypothetical protein